MRSHRANNMQMSNQVCIITDTKRGTLTCCTRPKQVDRMTCVEPLHLQIYANANKDKDTTLDRLPTYMKHPATVLLPSDVIPQRVVCIS